MGEPEVLALPNGCAVLYSARAPDKGTPNEDAAVVLLLDERRFVLAVADGVGGLPAGDQAARLSLETLVEALSAPGADGPSLRPAVLDGIERANERVQGLGVGAATTLAVVTVDGDRMRPYHVGDSTILAVGQRGLIRLQTVDHSPTGYGVEAGLLREAEAIHHEERHIVSNVVGSASMRIEVGAALHLRPRDTLLLATDGLFDNLRLDEIVQRIRKGALAAGAQTLAAAGRRRMTQEVPGQPSKPDDLTFVLYRPQPGRAAA
jgi:serine/threonine protein phosphatase PrpC